MKHRTLAMFASVLLVSPALLAQFRASIQGTVTDTTSAIVQGATVTLTDLGTAKVLTSTSDANGLYSFNALPPDEFSLVVDRGGFKKKVIDHVHIIPEQTNALNVQLEAGGQAETVTVEGDTAPALDTATASISGTIGSNEIQHLPSFNRDVFQLARLAPGSFGDGSQSAGGGSNNLPGSNLAGSGSTDGIFKTENAPQIVSNGGHNESNGISIDGISTVSAVWGGASVITPTEDSVGDVKIVSNSYDAETGRFTGAQIQVTSKAGTNDFHGSLFFKADRPGLNAYQRYNTPNTSSTGTPAERGLQRDESRFNQYGGSVGGPIWKNKLFAFFAYETIRNHSSTTGLGWYDTSQFDSSAPSGSIANTFLTFTGAAVSSSGQISASCANAGLTEGVNCKTVTGGIDIGSPLKTALGTQDLGWTGSSNPGVGSGLDGTPDIAEYTTLNPTTQIEQQFNGRFDAEATKNDRFTFTVYWVPVDTTSYNGSIRAYNLYHHSAINDAFAVIWNHTFSPTFLNEARVNAAGWRWNEVTTNPQEPFGLPEDTISQIGGLDGSSGSTTFNTFGASSPSVYDQWTYSYQDVATKVAGRHTVKFGGGVTRLYYLNENTGSARPSYTFYNVWDFLNDAPKAESGNFDPLTGTPTANRQDNREDIWGFFVQDDWKPRPNVTINLGMRYSYFGSMSAKQNNLNVVELGTGANTLTDLRIRRGGNLYESGKGNFGPQLGFAWTPSAANGKLVLRGGFGLNYNQEEIAIAANGNNNPPAVTSPNFSSVSPSQISSGIVYAIPADHYSLYGYPSNPNTIVSFNANYLPTTGSIGVTGFPGHVPTAYTSHYSLDTQYDLGHQLVASLGYQSSLGRHIIHQLNYNVLGAANGWALNTAVNSVDYYNNEGASNYHALLAGLKHQFAKGFLLDAQYTWSKSMDDGSQPYYEDPYPYAPQFAYGRSDYNVGQVFKVYGLWQPVLFRGHGLLEKVAGGWSLSGILNLHSGFPWTPVYSTGSDLYYQGSGYSSLRPAAYLGGAGHNYGNDAFKSGTTNFPKGGLGYFTIPTYTIATTFPATSAVPENPGVSRNSFTGPRYKDVDATLSKAFGLPHAPGLGESAKLEVRVDAYNVFNNLNFNVSSIAHTITDANFGQATSALGSRTLDIQARFSF